MKFLRSLAVAAACIGTFSGAQAAACNPSFADNGGIPDTTNIVVAAPASVLLCAGFYDQNVNSGSAQDLATVNGFLSTPAWSGYGLTTTGPIEQINAGAKLNTSTGLVNFDTLLVGKTLVSFHWGNFGSQNNPAGNVTAFYLIDAGAGLDTFQVAVTGGLSNAAIWTVAAPIPEPETYAMMLAGLGALGFMARRRKNG